MHCHCLEDDILATLCVSQKVLFRNKLSIHMDQARIKAECEYEFQYELAHYNECIRSQFSFSPITPVSSTARCIGWCEKLYQSFEK